MYYLVKSYTYNPRRVEGILELIKHYVCKSEYLIANTYYSLIKNYYELEYLSDDLSTKLFANVMDYSFYLPYYMIIVSSYTHDFQLGLKMYLMIFEKKSYSSDWWMNNLIWNLRFYLPHAQSIFIYKFREYIKFIEQNTTYRFDKSILSEYGIKTKLK